jgi:hypothetical protein
LPMPKKFVSKNQLPDEEVLNFDKPDFSFIPSGDHRWRQQGPYLVCKSCELQHAVYIGSDKIMVGLDGNGKPILKNRKSVQRL